MAAALALLGGGRAAGDGADYAGVAQRIMAEEKSAGQAYTLLAHLTDRIGPRLAGSEGAARAVEWSQQALSRMGLRTWTEPVRVPRWVRGLESGEIVAPAPQRLALTALGGSPPTPAGGLTADVVEVTSLEALAALPEAAVKGHIVFFNHAMAAAEQYGSTSPLRTRGPAAAARRGAAAALVRSLGTLNARLPHTGSTQFEEKGQRIPAAAVAAEDADLLHRLLAGGRPVRVHLLLTCEDRGLVDSANVLAELPGRERPEEVVLIGAHLDSWDLGTGAIDDGAGVVQVMETLRLLKSLGLTPRRTVRGVLFMNEEHGLDGARAYALAHAAELGRHVAAMESDSGGGRPTGVSARVGGDGLALLSGYLALTAPAGTRSVGEGGGGADLIPLQVAGVPEVGLRHDTRAYFHWHHTAADTLDKVDPDELAEGTARMAILAYVLAEEPDPLPRPAATTPPLH
jgi:carboxypeptidase Q